MMRFLRLKKILSPVRTMALLLVVGIFAVSGIGIAFAPMASHVRAAWSGNLNRDTVFIGNHQISNLPRGNVKLGTRIESRPTIDPTSGTRVDLYFISSIRTQPAVRVLAHGAPLTWMDGEEQVHATYDRLGNFEWRFYQSGTCTNDASGHVHDASICGRVLIHTHNVEVYQETFTFEIPASANHAHDGGQPSFVPTIVENNRKVLFPMPNKFVNTRGVDLFERVEREGGSANRDEVIEGRRAFVDSLSNHRIPYLGTTANFVHNTTHFQRLVWANTEISFPSARASQGGYIFGTTSDMEPARNARTLQESLRGTYFATYTLRNSTYSSVQNSSNVQVEFVSSSNVSGEIIFNRSFSFAQTLGANGMTFGTEATLPLPTVTTATAADEGVSVDTLGFRPVTFTQNIAQYTFIEVWRAPLGNPGNFGTQPIATVTSEEGYKFTPTQPGVYRLRYFTTTIFGTGNYAHITNANNRPEVIERNGVNYIVYTPHSLIIINRNEVAPEIRWTVPFQRNAATGVVTYRHTSDLFGTTAGETVFHPETQNDRFSSFDKMPDLSHMMPATGTTSEMRLDVKDQFVIPALAAHGNINTGKFGTDLQYILTLSRGAINSRASIIFDSNQPTHEGTRFHYDHTQPIVIDFNVAGAPTFTNGANEGTLSAFTGGHTETYTLSVTVNDHTAAQEVFENANRGRASIAQSYTFQLVTDAGANIDPQFNGSISVDKREFYIDEVLSFGEMRATDRTTPNVNIDYFLVWGTDGFMALDNSHVRGGRIIVDFADFDENSDLIQDLEANGGLLSIRIVAVAKNYRTLMTLVDERFVGDAIDRDALDILIADNTNRATNVNDGTAVTTTEVRLYDVAFGQAATITPEFGSKTTCVGPAYCGLSSCESICLTPITSWQEYFEYHIAEQHSTIDMPNIHVQYGDAPIGRSAQTISTTIEISMQTTRGIANTGLVGDRFVQTSLTEGVGSSFERINNLEFTPRQLGIHTFVVTVRNVGNHVSVFTGQINVTGVPVINPVLNNDGTSTLRIGQAGRLPSVSAFINGEWYVTDGNNQIILRDSDGLGDNIVGRYRIVGNIENASITNSVNNTFIPFVEGTYEFTYELVFFTGRVTNLSRAIEESIPTTINVTGLEQGDLSVGIIQEDFTTRNILAGQFERAQNFTSTFVGDEFKNINGTTNSWWNSHASGNATDGWTGAMQAHNTVRSHNVIPEMALTNATSFTFNDLDASMFMVESSTASGADPRQGIYEFGPIFLPRIRAEWAQGINMAGSSFDISKDSYVTVRHSRSTDLVFDSRKIGASSNHETRVAEIGGHEFYYFQPVGQVDLRTHNFATNEAPAYGRNISRLVDRNTAPDGVYTVTYTIAFGGITATTTFEIAIGDTHNPIIELIDETEFNKNHRIDSLFTFCSSWIEVNANSGWLTPQTADQKFADWYVARNLTVSIQRPGASGHLSHDEIDISPSLDRIAQWESDPTKPNFDNDFGYNVGVYADDTLAKTRQWQFRLNQSGEYRVTVTIASASGMTDVKTFIITVDPERTRNRISPQTIWGTILIVISSGLLLGVVVYFIQTGRKTKFAGVAAKTAKSKKEETLETPVEPEPTE